MAEARLAVSHDDAPVVLSCVSVASVLFRAVGGGKYEPMSVTGIIAGADTRFSRDGEGKCLAVEKTTHAINQAGKYCV